MSSLFHEGFRAEMPCPCDRCTTRRNGREFRSRLRLCTERVDGYPIETPVYRCERDARLSKISVDGEVILVRESPCHFRLHPLPAHEVRESYVRRPRGKRAGEELPESCREGT